MHKVWMIGQGDMTRRDFILELKKRKIHTVVDIRSNPHKSKDPRFTHDRIQSALLKLNMSYFHVPELVGPGTTQQSPTSTNTYLLIPMLQVYADHCQTREFRHGLYALVNLAKTRRTAVFCHEDSWTRCKRSLIADILVNKGWRVFHICHKANKVDEHRYNSHMMFINKIPVWK